MQNQRQNNEKEKGKKTGYNNNYAFSRFDIPGRESGAREKAAIGVKSKIKCLQINAQIIDNLFYCTLAEILIFKHLELDGFKLRKNYFAASVKFIQCIIAL